MAEPMPPNQGGAAGLLSESRMYRRGVIRRRHSFCAFRAQGHCYALDVAWVREVFPVTEVCTVPLAPAAVLGICNLRGTALTLLDLAAVLGAPAAAGRGPFARGLVLGDPGLQAALAIDTVETVRSFRGTPVLARETGAEHGLTRPLLRVTPQSVAVLLDGEELLARLDRLRLRPKRATEQEQQ